MEKYSADYFTGNLQWGGLVSFYQSFSTKKRFLEIGSFEGRSTNWICDNMIGDGVVHCVDPWNPFHPSLCGIEIFLENTERNKEKIIVHQGSSKHFLKEFALNKVEFDFIFIDGNHNRNMVLQDAVNSFDVLREGCYMVFDDYSWEGGDGPWHRPKDGIDCFIKCYELFIEVIFAQFHVIVKKLKEAL